MTKCVITEYILSQLDENQCECSVGISDRDVSKDTWLNYKLEVSFVCVDYGENHKFRVGSLMPHGLCLSVSRQEKKRLSWSCRRAALLRTLGPSVADCVYNLPQLAFSRVSLFPVPCYSCNNAVITKSFNNQGGERARIISRLLRFICFAKAALPLCEWDEYSRESKYLFLIVPIFFSYIIWQPLF